MKQVRDHEITYRISGNLSDDELNGLYSGCWPDHVPQSYRSVLEHSLLFVTAYQSAQLIGFVNLAWDGGEHTFFLTRRYTQILGIEVLELSFAREPYQRRPVTI